MTGRSFTAQTLGCFPQPGPPLPDFVVAAWRSLVKRRARKGNALSLKTSRFSAGFPTPREAA
jgi:hypothetical protein